MSGAFGGARSGRRAYPRPLEYESGPWRAVRDHVDPTTAQPDLLKSARNMRPESPEIGGGWISRPGFEPATEGAALGDLSGRQHQGIVEFTRSTGDVYRVVVVYGHFYTYDWATATFTEQSLGGLVIDPDAPHVFLVPFADYLVVSDGVNRPIAWNGTSFTEMTACPVLAGQPWVYVAKLFGIDASDPLTFVWSEERDPFTGYDSGGYNNAWQLSQTDTNRLHVGIGLNDGMIILRARSGTTITGAVNQEFQSTATRDGLSETIGSTSPAAVVVAGRNVFFLDADKRPQLLSIDGGLRGSIQGGAPPLWTDCREAIRSIPAAVSTNAIALYHQALDVVLFGVPGLGETVPSFFLQFDAITGDYLGTWTGFTATAVGIWTDLNGKPRMVHGSTDGIPYIHGLPSGDVRDDGFAAGAVAIDHWLETGPIGYDTKLEKSFDRVDVSVRALTTLSGVFVSHRTSGSVYASQELTFAGGQSVWGALIWGVGVWSTTSAEQHGDLGTAAWGRYTSVRLQHQVLGESFGAMRLTVEASVLGPTPGTP